MPTVMVGRYPLTICMACAMHMIWAVGLLFEPAAIHATGLHTVLLVARDPSIAAVLFALVAAMAIVGLTVEKPLLRVSLIIWQQVVLWFSTAGAVHAMYIGQFADGIQRANWFLIVDQVPVILITLGHMTALLLIAGEHDDA